MFSSHRSQRARKPGRFLPRLEELETRALPSTYVSTNWSGYGAESPNFSSPANYSVTKVVGSWVVPTVTNNSSFGWSSTWVGIDGFSSSTVEQIGTEQDTSLTSLYYGMPQYYAWYEMYPAYPVLIPLTIKAGDSITASVTYSGPATSSAGSFTLSLTNNTSGAPTYSITQTLTSAKRSSAEWIEEAPSSNSGPLPLANFGKASFTGSSATVGGVTGPISAFPNASIDMITKFGATQDTTSALNGTGDGFSVTYVGSSSGGGGGRHRHTNLATVSPAGQVPTNNVPPMQTLQPSAPVASVARPAVQTLVAPAIVQTPQTAVAGFLIVAPSSTNTTAEEPQKDNQQGDGAANQKPNSSATTSRLIDVPGGTMSRQALDEFFADPINHQQTSGEDMPTLVGTTAPAIDVTAGAELTVLLLGAYLGNPVKAKETEDNTKRKVRWL